MTVNYYFQSGVPESFSANQRLVEELTIEAIQIAGMETYYIPRHLINVDTIFTEDRLSTFKDAFPLEMQLEQVNGFEGDGSLLSKFGITVNDTCTFVVARRRWEAEVGRTGKSTLSIRPTEGDIIYLPITKSLFEIKKVVGSNPFYQLGKLFTYKLECELFQYASETFSTGINEIDIFPNMHSGAEEAQIILSETGETILDEAGNNLIQDVDFDDIDGGAQNNEFAAQVDVLDFSEHNPFAEVSH